MIHMNGLVVCTFLNAGYMNVLNKLDTERAWYVGGWWRDVYEGNAALFTCNHVIQVYAILHLSMHPAIDSFVSLMFYSSLESGLISIKTLQTEWEIVCLWDNTKSS